MKAAVIYESEFGATEAVARAICEGLASRGAFASAWSVDDAERCDSALLSLDLLILGAPTRRRTLPAHAVGMRGWLARAELAGPEVDVFVTRADLPRVVTGSALRALTNAAERAHGDVVEHEEEFLVRRSGLLVDGELRRAREWGRRLALQSDFAEIW